MKNTILGDMDMWRKKSVEKGELGALAERKEYFNSAVSLYYYNIFLRLKCYLKDKDITVEVNNKSSHKNVIEAFKNALFENEKTLGLDEFKILNNEIEILLKKRKKADYAEDFMFNADNYIKEFKDGYDRVDNFLKTKGI